MKVEEKGYTFSVIRALKDCKFCPELVVFWFNQGNMLNKIGVRIGRLVVIQELPEKNERMFLCKCDCGKTRIARYTSIFRKSVSKNTSCGCWGKRKKYKTKSVVYYRRLYNVWHTMLLRCHQKHSYDYYKYGARGIKVCKRWHNFSHFYNDVINEYRSGLTIERKDVNGDYKPSNCTWIPNEDQAKNRRSTVWVDGLCAKDFCKKHSIGYHNFMIKKNKTGMSIQELKDYYKIN